MQAQNRKFDALQKFGRTLMLPIAVLPVAGLLLRLGQGDALGWQWMADAGGAVFSNLPLLFAIGIALGFAKENHGAAALSGAIGYFVLTTGATSVAKANGHDINMGVLGGIISGLVAGNLYNRFRDIKLPEALAFFAGKRFVPIVTGFTSIILAFIVGWIWPSVEAGIGKVGGWAVGAGAIGVFVYGFLNRLLIPLGLHHVINSLAWFVLGDFNGPKGLVHGDLNRFYAGDPTAGGFMAGFFPVMMFGLPAACIAMIQMAKPENRRRIAGILGSAALVSFVTGITEPIEFGFMFLAPVLYVIHAILTGLSLAICSALGVKVGFTFSGGAIDFVLSKGISTNWWTGLVIGIVYFFLYYGVFLAAIKMWNLKTPGREDDVEVPAFAPVATASEKARRYLAALGGRANVLSLDACATRLRVSVTDGALVKEPELKALGAKGVIRPSAGSLQVVVGPTADALADEINAEMKAAAKTA
jgi:PTS system N-acetylglucosamine-specific IIC component